MKPNYEVLCQSILNEANWNKERKYLIPAQTLFLITVMSKYPQVVEGHLNTIKVIVEKLLNQTLRMESEGLKISQVLFEKLGNKFDNGDFLRNVLRCIFMSLHFYRNNTKSKVIPTSIMKTVHTFFAHFMIMHGTQALLAGCDSVQKDIFYMIMKSEGRQIKFVTEPARDKRYTLIAYSRFIAETAQVAPHDAL
jgi:hypothetical protein